MPTRTLDVTVSKEGELAVVALTGDLDSRTAPVVQEHVGRALAEHRLLALDLSNLRYMSSAGLRVMLLSYRQAQCASGQMAVVGLSEELRMLMSAVGFLNFFTVAEDLGKAAELLTETP
ncbi:STAS domain-containing protein [Streptosporangium sandarakinum]|uniref:Anti-sigma factor antagonist n=1 Tax=Streptosporangium sandarakinum TaxID=1260955 RepID=A0A852V618_9ACTN|nr:STAS domain-containing protein [Streptosporangium sandarakinum]NYF41415.1 anti-sigma B factor antagonist [Streptosporangium sandarakinum]